MLSIVVWARSLFSERPFESIPVVGGDPEYVARLVREHLRRQDRLQTVKFWIRYLLVGALVFVAMVIFYAQT